MNRVRRTAVLAAAMTLVLAAGCQSVTPAGGAPANADPPDAAPPGAVPDPPAADPEAAIGAPATARYGPFEVMHRLEYVGGGRLRAVVERQGALDGVEVDLASGQVREWPVPEQLEPWGLAACEPVAAGLCSRYEPETDEQLLVRGQEVLYRASGLATEMGAYYGVTYWAAAGSPWVVADGPGWIRRIDPASGQAEMLAEGFMYAVPAPDRRTAALVDHDPLAVSLIDPVRGTVMPLETPDRTSCCPEWSPDGGRVAVSAAAGDDRWIITEHGTVWSMSPTLSVYDRQGALVSRAAADGWVLDRLQWLDDRRLLVAAVPAASVTDDAWEVAGYWVLDAETGQPAAQHDLNRAVRGSLWEGVPEVYALPGGWLSLADGLWHPETGRFEPREQQVAPYAGGAPAEGAGGPALVTDEGPDGQSYRLYRFDPAAGRLQLLAGGPLLGEVLSLGADRLLVVDRDRNWEEPTPARFRIVDAAGQVLREWERPGADVWDLGYRDGWLYYRIYRDGESHLEWARLAG